MSTYYMYNFNIGGILEMLNLSTTQHNATQQIQRNSYTTDRNTTQHNAMQCNKTQLLQLHNGSQWQRNATQHNGLQHNAVQRNATQQTQHNRTHLNTTKQEIKTTHVC